MLSNFTYEQLIIFFKDNPIAFAITSLLTILSFILMIIFYFKSKKCRVPTYIVRTVNLVKQKIKKIESVEIFYSGGKVDNLSISKIAFWNAGKETINNADVPTCKPINIVIDNEFKILDAEIIFQKNLANNFKLRISEDKRSILITFEYLDFEEGAVFQVYHTGNNSNNVKIEGAVKSAKNIIRKSFSKNILPKYFLNLIDNGKLDSEILIRQFIGWTFTLAGVVLCLVIFFFPYIENSLETYKGINQLPIYKKILLLIPGLIYIRFGYRYLSNGIPKGFNIFIEEF